MHYFFLKIVHFLNVNIGHVFKSLRFAYSPFFYWNMGLIEINTGAVFVQSWELKGWGAFNPPGGLSHQKPANM